MAKKISDLTAAAALSGSDLFEVVQGAGSYKALLSDIKTFCASDAQSTADSAAVQSIGIAVNAENALVYAGAAQAIFRMPYAFEITEVRASLGTAQGSGSILTVDINESGASILSTKLTIDNGEKTSTTASAPAVISDVLLADDAEISIDVDQIGNATARGLKVYLIGKKV